jgi:hypothetical protein
VQVATEFTPQHLASGLCSQDLLQVGQLDRAVVLALLNVVPNKLVCHPGRLLSRQLGVMNRRVGVNGEALAAIAADNRLRRISGGAVF